VTIGTNTMARLAFVAVLLIATATAGIWYFRSVSAYATYQIHTEDPVSGLAIDAPIEFHGVEVGKVKNITVSKFRFVGYCGCGARPSLVTRRDSLPASCRGWPSLVSPSIAGEPQIYFRNGVTAGFPNRFSSAADNVAQWLPP
jgi:hypothetical protein